MSKKRGRDLSSEDRALWDQVARSTNPLDKPAKRLPDFAGPKDGPEPKRAAKPIPAFQIGEKAGLYRQETSSPLPKSRSIDKRSYTRMRRGKLEPEARIDLHGLTVAAAHPALIGFILRAQAEGKRMVLVITGKGRKSEDQGPIPERRGILRQQLPQWLTTPPLASIVLEVVESHHRHGGSGAFYIYLRRRR